MKKITRHMLPLAAALLVSSTLISHADTPPTVRARMKQGEWKQQPVRTLEMLAPLPAEPTVDAYGGRTDRTLAKTGFIRTQKIGDRWWLVDPAGHPLIHVGVVNVTPMSHLAEGAPSAQWAQSATRLLQSNSFNGIGAWSATPLLRAASPPLVYTVIHSFMSSFAGTRKLSHSGVGHAAYPNDCIPVFHPDFAAYCDDYAKSLATDKNDPYLMGYFSDNELPIPELDKFLALDSKDLGMGSSQQAAQAWLNTRKGKTATAADITEADRTAWTGYVFGRYFALTTAAIRKYDPHHLCLGPRLYGRSANSEAVFRAAGPYLDVIAMNYYGVWNPSLSSVAHRTEWSGKPILISEFYAKGNDSGFSNMSGAGWTVDTQHDRGLFYQTFTLGLLEAKNCVGWQWFKYMDNDPKNSAADPSNRDSNKGIVTLSEQPYLPLVEQMRNLNQHVYAVADKFDRNTPTASVMDKAR